MVEPNGLVAAFSGSTWIHWWSSVRSAKPLMRSWSTVCHAVGPSSTPRRSLRSCTLDGLRRWPVSVMGCSELGEGGGLETLNEYDAGFKYGLDGRADLSETRRS